MPWKKIMSAVPYTTPGWELASRAINHMIRGEKNGYKLHSHSTLSSAKQTPDHDTQKEKAPTSLWHFSSPTQICSPSHAPVAT